MANPYPHHSASANGSSNRMNDLLDAVKNDYAALNHEVALLRQQREEIERQSTTSFRITFILLTFLLISDRPYK
jgi:hypothetical protein